MVPPITSSPIVLSTGTLSPVERDYKKGKEHYARALKYYNEALERDSKNIDALLNKGIVPK
jgi:hypothetical protein